MRISFLAAGFFANLVAYLPEDTFDWSNCGLISTDVKAFCNKLVDIIDYDSDALLSQFCLNHFTLSSFVQLFKASDKVAAQVWALWAMFNVFKLKLERVEVERTTLLNFLKKIKEKSNYSDKIQSLCDFGVRLVEQSRSN